MSIKVHRRAAAEGSLGFIGHLAGDRHFVLSLRKFYLFRVSVQGQRVVFSSRTQNELKLFHVRRFHVRWKGIADRQFVTLHTLVVIFATRHEGEAAYGHHGYDATFKKLLSHVFCLLNVYI